MPTKTCFQRLPKRDRDEVVRLDAHYSSPPPETMLAEGLRRVRDMARNSPKGSSLPLALAGEFFGLMSRIQEGGIIRRLRDDNVAPLRTSVNTAARLQLLTIVAGGKEWSSSSDCGHVFAMIRALAVDDWPLINAFVSRFPGPFSDGHPATVLFANALYGVLRDDRAALEHLDTRIRQRKESSFFQAMSDTLVGIMGDDAASVAASIGTLIKYNRRQDQMGIVFFNMEKLICLMGHGLFNLCRRKFSARGLSVPEIAAELTWDAEFQRSVEA
ncbi:MAG TPA: hypothetical protein VEA69_00095, partial [Tepidisphaeraceae bacterium]|nr:hypothetical protein [Tepidisphaeraceae bacterium]